MSSLASGLLINLSVGSAAVAVEFRTTKEGEIALFRGHAIALVIAPITRGGDYWCRHTGTNEVVKGLTRESAHAVIRNWIRQIEERDRGPVERIVVRAAQEVVRNESEKQDVDAARQAPVVWVTQRLDPNGFNWPVSIQSGKGTGKRGRHLARRRLQLGDASAGPREIALVDPAIARALALKPTECPLCHGAIGKVGKHFRKCHPSRLALVPAIEALLATRRGATLPSGAETFGRSAPEAARETSSTASKSAVSTGPAAHGQRDRGERGRSPIERQPDQRARSGTTLKPTRDLRWVTPDGRPRKRPLPREGFVRCLACCRDMRADAWMRHELACPCAARTRTHRANSPKAASKQESPPNTAKRRRR